jgi:hypothetical protein
MAKDKDYSSEKLEVLKMLRTSSQELDDVIREIVDLCSSIKNNT